MHEDEPLLARLRGDGPDREGAIAELRATLLRGLTRSLDHRYGQPIAVEDVVQEALLKILASLDKFEGRSRFLTWAMTIATRIGISSVRRKHHRDLSLEAFSDADGGRIEMAIDSGAGASVAEERRELLELLQRLIDTELTEKQRIATRAMLSGYSSDGIAEQTGTNRNAVYKLIHDARARLKEGFAKAGVSAEDVSMALA
ncbi:MAG: RNA polymerase sigma factor [Lacipirellulaceae bacterium]